MSSRRVWAFPALVAVVVFFTSGSGRAAFGQPTHTQTQTENIPAGGARLIRVVAGPGSLRIKGVRGLSEVRVAAVSSASDPEALKKIRLVTRREGDIITVTAAIPDNPGAGSASMDIVLEVPGNAALAIRDTSGNIEISDVGSVDLDDESGDIRIQRVAGDIRVNDDSGEIDIFQAVGNIDIRDDSGNISIARAGGNISIDDGSGDINVSDAYGNIIIRDSSGDIRIQNVNGDLIVKSDGSGNVQYSNVRGRVVLP